MSPIQEAMNVLRFKPWKHMPIIQFGYFWNDTLVKWHAEGHITDEELSPGPNMRPDYLVAKKLGFDFAWCILFNPHHGIYPHFTEELIEELPGNARKVRNWVGVTELRNDDARGIPAETDHLLKTRADWDRHYKHRFAFSEERFNEAKVDTGSKILPFNAGGRSFLESTDKRETPIGLFGGSLVGHIRDIAGLELFADLQMDVEGDGLFTEMVQIINELSIRLVERSLEMGLRFEYLHFWEDIACRNGPLIVPKILAAQAGPYYRRICEAAGRGGLDIVSLDSDGDVTALVPVWIENGVNVMFPIEVGTWNGNILPWRQKYGKAVRGIGGMDKRVFAHDRAAVDAEIERLRKLVDLGGFLPCPDHSIPPDAKWENVAYYCERMRRVFGG